MFGLLVVNKPSGITSRDVVNRVQRCVRPHKAGHAGTLDPLATGVLVVCLGQATRLTEYVQQMPKRYVGTFLLGRESDTEDVEGTVVELPNAKTPTEDELRDVLPQFLGRIQQMPPVYSALKVGGQRAYDLARAGKEVTLAAREIEVHAIDLVSYRYPEVVLDIRCGSGTYVRSLGRDIARAVGTQAVMSALVRTEIGPFTLEQAASYDELDFNSITARLRPAHEAVANLPTLRITAAEATELLHGRRITNREALTAAEIAAIDESEHLLAILQPVDGTLKPIKVFPP